MIVKKLKYVLNPKMRHDNCKELADCNQFRIYFNNYRGFMGTISFMSFASLDCSAFIT